MDTPGILWPKFDDQTVGLHLAWIGAISDNVNIDELTLLLIEFLQERYAGTLNERFSVDETAKSSDILTEIEES